jgi:ankyrin repeat protein
MSPHLNNRERQHLENHFTFYIRNYFLERTTQILHIGVERLFNRKFQTSDNLKPIIKLILEIGADPNGINFTGATPLHLMADEAYRFTMA